jgi:hypothetical protein
MLVERRYRRGLLLLSGISALVAGTVAAASLSDFHVYDGLLPAEQIMGSLGFDAMSLLVAIGVIGCLYAIERGREEYWLLWLGLQSYMAYAYALYAFGLVFTRLYFVYLAILCLSVFSLALFREALPRGVLAHWHAARMPRRTMAAFLFALVGVIAVFWFGLLSDSIRYHDPLPAGTVIVLDLAFTLPLLGVVGVLLLRGRPLGDLLATGVFAMSAAITLGVAAAELFRPLVGDVFSPELALPFFVPGLICLVFAVVAFRRVSPAVTHGARRNIKETV